MATCETCHYRSKSSCRFNPPVPQFVPNPIDGSPTLVGLYPPVGKGTEACGQYKIKTRELEVA